MPDQFWKLTYNEFLLLYKYHRKKEIRRRNELVTQAWYVAAFSRQDKLPDINKYLQDEDAETKPQTDEEMLARCRMWNAALGGQVVEV